MSKMSDCPICKGQGFYIDHGCVKDCECMKQTIQRKEPYCLYPTTGDKYLDIVGFTIAGITAVCIVIAVILRFFT